MSHRPPGTQGVWQRRCVRWGGSDSNRGVSSPVVFATAQFAGGLVLFGSHKDESRERAPKRYLELLAKLPKAANDSAGCRSYRAQQSYVTRLVRPVGTRDCGRE